MKYSEACKIVGYDRSVTCPIDRGLIYRAYKNGECTIHKTRDEALRVSKLIETAYNNDEAWQDWYVRRQELESKAQEIWYTALKNEYIDKDFSEELFNICYSKAYDDGHAHGYDEVYNCLYDIVDFAIKVRNCK